MCLTVREHMTAPKFNNQHDAVFYAQCSVIPGLPLQHFDPASRTHSLRLLELHGVQVYTTLIGDALWHASDNHTLCRLILSEVILCNNITAVSEPSLQNPKDPISDLFEALSDTPEKNLDLHISLIHVSKAGWDGTITVTNDQIKDFLSLSPNLQAAWMAAMTAHFNLSYPYRIHHRRSGLDDDYKSVGVLNKIHRVYPFAGDGLTPIYDFAPNGGSPVQWPRGTAALPPPTGNTWLDRAYVFRAKADYEPDEIRKEERTKGTKKKGKGKKKKDTTGHKGIPSPNMVAR